MLSCEDVVELVTDYDEGALSTEERRGFEAHVVICPPCRGFVGQIRALRTQLPGSGAGGTLPPELEESIVQAFRAWRRES